MSCPKCKFQNEDSAVVCQACEWTLTPANMEASQGGRKLKQHGSHPDSPEKKKALEVKVPSDDDDMQDDEENVKTMFRSMMGLMKEVQKDVKDVKQGTKEAKDIAAHAVKTAVEANQAVQALEKRAKEDTDKTRKSISALEATVQAMKIDDVKGSRTTSPAAGKGFGKGGGKEDKKREERSRTIVFSNFPEDTQEVEIISMIESKMQKVSTNVEEVFAYAKSGSRGAAKFKTEDAMWDYMVSNKGQHIYQHGGNKVYVKAGGGTGNAEQDLKEKAVRKAVRALIEREGGEALDVKKRIDAKYPWGAVWWMGQDGKWEKICQWNAADRKMVMLGSAEPLQTAVDRLLE